MAPAPPPAPTEAPAPAEAEVHAHEHTFCPNCGTKHAPGVHYCEECGQPLFTPPVPTEHDVS
jgi:hypothetical protein